jgi:hypothetical protein
MNRTKAWCLVVVAGAGVTFSCVQDRATSPSSEPSPGPSVVTVAGTPIPENLARAGMQLVTRLVALGLRDSNARAYVFDQLHGSPYREHKLHFAPFLSKVGSPLLARIAAMKGVPESAVGGMLDSLIDLEFYMPVKDHWARWTGGPDLIVATALKDHEIPVAYDLDGHPVPLTSSATPPSTPTLAIVPVETDFSVQRSSAQCYENCGGVGGGGSPPPPGLNMTFSYIGGDWEGFLMGDPEFEVHVLTIRRNTSGAHDYRCAGEHAPIWSSVYDQNGTSWSGNVELLSYQELNTFAEESTHTIVQVWEDDKEACIIRKDREWVTAAVSAVLGFVGVSVDFSIVKKGWYEACSPDGYAVCWASILVFPFAPLVLIAALQNDDYVGTVVPTSVAGVSYSDANYVMLNEKGVIKGRVMLTGAPYVSPPLPGPQLHAEISGPSALAPNTTCTWSVGVTGASGSINYQWYRDGTPVSSSSSYTGSSGSGFTLAVYVSNGSHAAADALTVSTSQGSYTCSP